MLKIFFVAVEGGAVHLLSRLVSLGSQPQAYVSGLTFPHPPTPTEGRSRGQEKRIRELPRIATGGGLRWPCYLGSEMTPLQR